MGNDALAFYAEPGRHTALPVDDAVSGGIQEIVSAVQGWHGGRPRSLEHGAHWIAGNLGLDLASLNKVEMLPWGVWGTGWEPGSAPPDEVVELFDAVAALTTDPDSEFQQLRATYDSDDRLRMDGTVFNVGRGDFEAVS